MSARRRLGLRREVLILLPAALLLLAGLSTFTLFAYRSALALLAEERREAAADLAARAAAELSRLAAPGPAELRRAAPGAAGVVLVTTDGRVVAAAGEPPAAAALAPAAGLPLDSPLAVGLDERLPDGVAGFAPLAGAGGRRIVRVDLAGGVLARSRRAAGVLTVVVLGVNGALILLVLAFLRHLLAPYEALLARARAAGDAAAPEEDEAEFLVATFERALAETEARRRAETGRLAESLSRLGEMAGGVAHELRNGLATLRGYLTLIERRPDEDSIADFLDEMRREADHLERVLDDFLAFARPGTARLEELSLPALLRRAAADPALDGVGVELAGAEGDEPRLSGDPQLLERALRNLLRNAAQAEREAGRSGPVEAVVERGPDGVELRIEDRGAGLPPAVRGRLFHPFVTGRAGGVGLGLALAHRIVLLHGGAIRLEDRPGGGTRVRIHFPADTIVTARNSSGGREDPEGRPA